ncbi:MAG: ABC transporter substrate-binding protein [Dehalococcoidia bacterium]
MLAGLSAAGAGALALACGAPKTRGTSDSAGSGSAPSGALATVTTGQVAPGAADQVKRGGTFVRVEGPPRSLDPHFDTFPANTVVTNNVYNTLLAFTPDLTKIEPELATAMPENPDSVTFVFKLRQGVKYHNVPPANGREMVAEDVKYSIERQMTNEPGKFQHAYYFLNKVTKIEAVDKYTVKFTTNKPMAPFLSYIASPWTQVILRELVEATVSYEACRWHRPVHL